MSPMDSAKGGAALRELLLGTAFAIRYSSDGLPDDKRLLVDLNYMTSLLGVIYAADDADPGVPGKEPPEIVLVNEFVRFLAGRSVAPGRGAGQGFGLSKEEQDLVAEHAVSRAMEHLRSLGWTHLKDVGATESYDKSAREEGRRRYVEVKGTTSLGSSVILTPNEVALHLAKYPDTALIVVHSIELDRSGERPVVAGGILREIRPWAPSTGDLQPMAYRYRVPEDPALRASQTRRSSVAAAVDPDRFSPRRLRVEGNLGARSFGPKAGEDYEHYSEESA